MIWMCLSIAMCIEEEKKERGKEYYMTPFVLSSQPGVGVGYANTVCLSACPFRGSRAARCFLHTPPHLHRLQKTFPRDTSHTLPSFPLSYSPLPSSSCTPLCCFLCPSFSPLSLQPQLFLPSLSCVLRLWLVCELEEHWVGCCWCYSCLGSMSPSGPAEEGKTAREPGNFNAALWENYSFYFFFFPLHLPCGTSWTFRTQDLIELWKTKYNNEDQVVSTGCTVLSPRSVAVSGGQ